MTASFARNKPLLTMVVVAAAIAAAALPIMMRVARSSAQRAALAPDQHMDALSIPAFTLTDQDGRPFTRDALLGRLTVLDFFFSRCPLACVPMTANMRAAQQALEGTGVRFVSVSVDPEHDGPERLRAHAARHEADLSTWTFLTGDMETIRSLARGALFADVGPEKGRVIQAVGGGEMENIQHPTKFLLIGPDARIIGIYDGVRREEVDQLVERARLGAKALAPR